MPPQAGLFNAGLGTMTRAKYALKSDGFTQPLRIAHQTNRNYLLIFYLYIFVPIRSPTVYGKQTLAEANRSQLAIPCGS